MRLKILTLWILLAGSTVSFGADLSDASAKHFLEDFFNKHDIAIIGGPVTVVTDDFPRDVRNSRIPTAEFNQYKAWEKLGILHIETAQDLTGKFAGWKDWNALTQEGVRTRVYVTATEKGWLFISWPNKGLDANWAKELAAKLSKEQRSSLTTTTGVKRVTRIVRNEQKKTGADEYRVVMGLYSAQWRPEVVQHRLLLGTKLAEKRKFIVLLKHDPFASTWKAIAADHANENEEFHSKNVDSTLRKLSAF